MLFTVVGAIISILGFISGIIVGTSVSNFIYCLFVWIGTFLFAIIYFGIGLILKNQEKILNIISPNTTTEEKKEVENNSPLPKDKWRCDECQTVNTIYVTKCQRCGSKRRTKEEKQDSEKAPE